MPTSQAIPVVLVAVAAVALIFAIWFAVRRPFSPTVSTKPRRSWHAVQVVLSASSATVAALCVLLAVGAR